MLDTCILLTIYIDKLYLPAQRKKYSRYKDENIYNSFYSPRNPGIDDQGAYFGDTL
jgi:hypothetical protein